jgi:hypothetical protein
VPPGKEGKITLAVEHTTNLSGEIAKSANVRTNDPDHSAFNLVLRARFKVVTANAPAAGNPTGASPKKASHFTLSPNDRWVSGVLSGSSASSHLYFYNQLATPVHIKSIVNDGTEFKVSLEPIQDGKRYELAISTNPVLRPGHYARTVKLMTDFPDEPEVPVQLEVTVYPKVFATPNAMYLPKTPSADALSLRIPAIYVRKLRGTGLAVKRVSSTLPWLKLSLSTETDGQVYKLNVSLDETKLPGPGEYRGTISIETNDADSPVIEVPVHLSFT